MKRIILVMSGYYLPGVKAGGPIRSIKNLIQSLDDAYEFKVVALDRDLGDESPYTNIKVNEWNNITDGSEKIYYHKGNIIGRLRMIKALMRDEVDAIYLNSFFSFVETFAVLALLRFKVIKVHKVILAPRGQFSNGAINIKAFKKKVYLKIFLLMRLHKIIHWHSTASEETKLIQKYFGDVQITQIKNLSSTMVEANAHSLQKIQGNLKLIYIGRIHPIKNLKVVFESLVGISANVELNIYGPIEDSGYWNECLAVKEKYTSNIKIQYHGVLDNQLVKDRLKENDVFISISHGENFGHSIVEALRNFTPVIISDMTPWGNLQRNNAGFNVNTNDLKKLKELIELFAKMNDSELTVYRKGARLYIEENLNLEQEIIKYKKMFDF